MNVLVLQKRMSLSNVKLPNINQIDCQFIDVFLLTDVKNYTRYIDLQEYCVNEFPNRIFILFICDTMMQRFRFQID
jgi:hypothetical protein